MQYRFCPRCGRKLTRIDAGDDGMVPFCGACQKRWFDAFESCVLVLTYNEFDEMVLARQPYISLQYSVVTSGYMVPGETPEETAAREVQEELGLHVEKLTYMGAVWMGAGDMLLYEFVAYAPRAELRLSTEVESAAWVPALEAGQRLNPYGPGRVLRELYQKFLTFRGLR